MAHWIDIAVCLLVVASALVVIVRRFRIPKPPACAPSGESKPQVIVGGTLAKALDAQRKSVKKERPSSV